TVFVELGKLFARQHLDLLVGELAVVVFVNQGNFDLAGHGIEAPFDLDVGVLAVLGKDAHVLLDPDMRMGPGDGGREQKGERRDEGPHATASCDTARGLPSSSIATNTKVPWVTWMSTVSWRR